MTKCINPDIGRLIGRYEFDLLTPEEKEEFEEHILKCDYCFRELYEFSPAVKTMKKNLFQFRKAVTGKLTFYEKIKSYVPNFIPEPVKPAIPALGFVFAAIIFISILWPIVKPSLKIHRADTQPSKIVLQDAEEMAHKGDMEKLKVADTNIVVLPKSDLMSRLNESMKIRLTANGDSLIFSWNKIDAVKSYHILLIYKDQTVSITPVEGIRDSIFTFPKKNINLEKIIIWELKADLFNVLHVKTQKIFQIKQ